ncbi:hypothetical protein FAIPA1_20028 [Frankia sp. AiPs1]
MRRARGADSGVAGSAGRPRPARITTDLNVDLFGVAGGSAGRPRPARITTGGTDVTRALNGQQRRTTTPGEDHNFVRRAASTAAVRWQRRTTTPGEDHNDEIADREGETVEQRRTTTPGDDHNAVTAGSTRATRSQQRRTTTPGEDHNPAGRGGVMRETLAAPDDHARRGSQPWSRGSAATSSWRQRRTTTPGEDHNQAAFATNAAIGVQRRTTTPGEDHNDEIIAGFGDVAAAPDDHARRGSQRPARRGASPHPTAAPDDHARRGSQRP